MSGRYRYEPSNGWLWILPPVGPSFASVYEKSASGADSNSRAVREIVIELNRLLDRAEKAETALADATQAHANERYQLQNAAIVAVEAQRKAEARVAELEAQVAATPVVCFDCGVVGAIYDETDSAGVVRNRVCGRCGSSWQVDAKTLEIPPVKTPMRDRIPPKPAKGEVWTPKARASDCPTHGPEQTVASRWTTETIAPVRFVCLKCSWVWDDPENAKTAPQTPVPAPEGTETVQKAPPPSPVGAPRSDRGAGIKSDTQSPGPGRSDPRASESSNLDTKRRATTCEDVKCPCVYAEDGPDVELSVAQPDTGLVRVLVDPAAAAEVEARTNAVATETLRAYVTWGPASPENMLTFTTPNVWIVTPPRAGLPSRDEVAAFLEGLKPPEPPAESRPCQRCRKPLPPERTWFHAECMDPRTNR